jgi:hypothetical protein
MQLLEMSGAVKKNPQRYRERSARERKLAAAGLGAPPEDWVKGAEYNERYRSLLATWNQIVAQDVMHVLNASHRLLVENTCYLMHKIRRASAGNGKATSGDYAQVKANLAAMGQTPVDSSRVAEAVRVPGQGDRKPQPRSIGWGEYVG